MSRHLHLLRVQPFHLLLLVHLGCTSTLIDTKILLRHHLFPFKSDLLSFRLSPADFNPFRFYG